MLLQLLVCTRWAEGRLDQSITQRSRDLDPPHVIQLMKRPTSKKIHCMLAFQEMNARMASSGIQEVYGSARCSNLYVQS